MKNKNIILTVLSALMLMGCGNNNSTSLNSNSNSSNTINSSSNIELSEIQKLDKMLNELRKGVKFVGVIDQKSNYLKEDHGEPMGDFATNTYNVELTYQSDEINAYSSYVTTTLIDGSTKVYFDNNVFQGEDGHAYYYDLNYNNKVEMFPFVDTSGSPVNFGYYCINPFSYIKAEDFIKVVNKENTYTLKNSKVAAFAANVLGDIDEAFYGLIENFEFTIENGALKGFTITPKDVYGMSIDFESWVYIYYLLEQKATFEVVDIATAKVDKPTPRVATSAKEDLDKLQNAFSKLAGNNFTATLKIDYADISGGGEAFATYYYTGEHLYYSKQEEQNAPNASTDILLYNNGEKYLTPYVYSDEASVDKVVFVEGEGKEVQGYTNYTYEDVIPVVSEVSAELFDYNKTFKNYSVCNEVMSDFATKAIVPQLNEMSNYLDGSIDSFKIKLTSSGELDYVSFSFYYDDGFFQEAASAKLYFSNIGTTELPYNLEIA